MNNLEDTALKPKIITFSDKDFQAQKFNQLRNFSGGESQTNWLSKTKKVLLTSAMDIAS